MKWIMLIGCLAFALSSQVRAQALDDDLAQAFGNKDFVSIATGNRQPLSQAPAAATVITAADIRAMGATDLDQVLESVPGLHVSHSALLNASIYSFRGIHSGFNPQVLMLINGNPVTSLFQGNRGLARPGVALHDVSRIEVIRGSGSALYGADAFSGVINITTKSAAEINGTEAGIGAGSYRTREAWVLHGGKWQGWDIAAYLRKAATDGPQGVIEADGASELDHIFGTHTSHAPGPGNTQYRATDASLELKRQNWQWRTEYSLRDGVGAGAGIGQALDPTGFSTNERLTSSLAYHNNTLWQDWDLTAQLNYFRIKEFSWVVIYPPGSFGGAFPDGLIGAPDKWERHLGLSAVAVYGGWLHHRIRFGAGVENYAMYRTRERKNFDFTLVPGSGYVLTPLGSVVDASAGKIFIGPQSRHLRYLIAQDEWNFAPDWTLTGGIRHDRYSDFGNTINPRLALIWKANYNLSTKLLYGRAFRAPSFTEQYNSNNPVNTGNPNVRPEKVATLEAGVNWQPDPALQLGLNLFHYKMNDLLRYVPNLDPSTGATAQNAGSQHGHGLELEAGWQATPQWRLSGNYAWQRSIDESTNQDAGLAPAHHIYLRSSWQMHADWALDGQINRIAGRQREPGDPRPTVANYQTLDLTLRYGNPYSRWHTTLALRNLFNADAREPSLAPGAIPFDLPLPRRNFTLTLDYKL